MKRPTCKTCPYWFWQGVADDIDGLDHLIDGDLEAVPGADLSEVEDGECRRHAPIAFAVSFDDILFKSRHRKGSVVDDGVVWPLMQDWEFCGEHPDFPAYIASKQANGQPA